MVALTVTFSYLGSHFVTGQGPVWPGCGYAYGYIYAITNSLLGSASVFYQVVPLTMTNRKQGFIIDKS